MSFIRVGIVICFAAASIFVNNSVYFEQLASVNGLSMTLTSLTRYSVKKHIICMCNDELISHIRTCITYQEWIK